INVNVGLRILRLEKKKLSNNEIRDGVINGCSDKYNALFEQAGIDVETALASRRLFDDDRNEIRRDRRLGSHARSTSSLMRLSQKDRAAKTTGCFPSIREASF